MEVFAARHPVFDGEQDVFAYDLRFRAPFEQYYEAMEADEPGGSLPEYLRYAQLVDGRRGLLRFPRELLAIRFPVLFPAGQTIPEVPAELAADDEAVAQCRELKDLGFCLAVGDFTLKTLDGPLAELADIAVVDLLSTPVDQLPELPEQLNQRGIAGLVRGVETIEDFHDAAQLGYTYFQGRFYTMPVMAPGKEVAPSKLTYLRLLREVNTPSLSYNEVAPIIEQDVAMTYKLLKFMNSAWFGLRFEINSVKHALVLLGPKEIKRWASLVAVRNCAADKPHELLLRALNRAKAAEQMGMLVGMRKEAPELFLMAMFTVLDALIDRPMEKALEGLPLKEDIRNALLGGESAFRSVHDAIMGYDRGEWERMASAAGDLGLPEEKVPVLFREGLQWAHEALQEM